MVDTIGEKGFLANKPRRGTVVRSPFKMDFYKPEISHHRLHKPRWELFSTSSQKDDSGLITFS